MEVDKSKLFNLTVHTSDETAESFIIDSQYHRIDSRVGDRITFQLPPGLYSVKVRVGSSFQEKPVTLLEDQSINFEPFQFSSSAPLENTLHTSSQQMENVDKYTKKEVADVSIGTGSRIFVYEDIYDDRNKNNDPFIGVTLRNDKDKILIDFEKPAFGNYSRDRESRAACDVEISPGSYSLCVEAANGEIFRQTIIASPGWQTQIFLTQRNYGVKETDARADLLNGSIFMARIGDGFNAKNASNGPDPQDLRLTELVRQALVNRRNVLSKDVLEKLFSGKIENPMLGIYAAHILLLNRDFIFSEIKTIVGNLRNLLREPHPDVESLALKMGMPTDYVFRSFPMLYRSWELVVEASVQRPEIVALNSLASKYAGQFWNCDLWLIWGKNNKDLQKNLFAQIKKATLMNLDVESSEANVNEEKKQEATQSEVISKGIDDTEKTAQIESTETKTTFEGITDDLYLSIVQALGIPRSNVDKILNDPKLSKDYDKAANKEVPVTKTEVKHADDPQKDMWGGKSEIGSRRMTATVTRALVPGFYVVNIIVESTDKNDPLAGKVKFHLHDTFLNPDPVINVEKGMAVLKLSAVWGAFTVGAEVDNGKTQLELDLAELSTAPKKFREL